METERLGGNVRGGVKKFRSQQDYVRCLCGARTFFVDSEKGRYTVECFNCGRRGGTGKTMFEAVEEWGSGLRS